VIARAKEWAFSIVAVVTRPFPFEGKTHADLKKRIRTLAESVDSLITIPNENC
jgi:cell division GTPase FtsZ